MSRGPLAAVRHARGTLVVLCLAGHMAAAAAEPAPPPCAGCAAIVLDTVQAERIVGDGIPLRGVPLVLPAGAPDALSVALAQLGAEVWLTRPVTDTESAAPVGDLTGVWLELPDGLARDRAVYLVRRAATEVRATSVSAQVGLRLTPELVDADAARAVAPYVDAVWVPADGPEPAAATRLYAGLPAWRSGGHRDEIPRAPVNAADRIAIAPTGDVTTAVRRLAVLADWLPPGLTPLEDVSLACDGCRATAWLHPDTLDAIAVAEVPAAGGTAAIAPAASRVTLIDLGAPGTPVEAAVSPSTGRATVVLPSSSGHLVLRIAGWRGADDEVFQSRVAVSARRDLTVEEILARHQAQRARQAALVRSDIAAGATVLTFDVPGFAGPVAITADTTIFTRGSLVEIAQSRIAVNGVDMGVSSRVPRLPIIEPERVTAPPFAITLSTAYTYRLAGRERVNGRPAYVVEFEPIDRRRPSFAGRAWIDVATFGLARMQAVQTGLRGAIVSSEQHDEFRIVTVGAREAWLPTRSSSYQVYQAAGQRTPIHREMTMTSHAVNAADFDARLDAAHESPAVMLRDTPQGFRYLVPAPARAAAGSPPVPGRRVVAPRAGEHVWTLAFGIIDDPNITVPLPYAGLSYLDFNFLDRGIQLSAFYGGTYGQLAWTVPRVVRPGWQVTGRVFGIAARYNDRSFRDGREQYAENIEQRPFHADATLVAPVSPRVQIRLGYELDVTTFRRGPDTSPTFLVPATAVVHGARVALGYQRGPWSALAWWNPARRQGWREWGQPGVDYRPGTSSFTRLGATIARSFVPGAGTVARLEASWLDGRDLDRFSRYSVDSFENVLHGYPSASLRFDRGALARSVVTWRPVAGLRLDGFADCAAVRDPGFGPHVRAYPGVGMAVEVPLPHRYLVAAEWAYGFEARTSSGTRGTQVFKLSGFKVF